MELNISGFKTYIVAIGLICWALGGLVAGKMEITTAIEAVLIALGMMGLRHGIEKKIELSP